MNMIEQPVQIILIYLTIVNVATFIVYGIDKWKAKRGKWRISEATLLGLALIGGSIGAWLGMKAWHQTMHKKFRYGVPLIFLAQVALFLLASCKSKATMMAVPTVQPEVVGEHSPSVFIVMYDKKVGKEPLLQAVEKCKAKVVYDYNNLTGMAIKKPVNMTLEATMEYFKKVKGVLSVEYDRVHHLMDSRYSKEKINKIIGYDNI